MTAVLTILEPTDISLRVFSLVRLYTAIYLRGDLFDTVPIAPADWKAPPSRVQSAALSAFQGTRMQLVQAPFKVHYSSAIALGIGAKLDQPADRVAARIVALWAEVIPPPQDPHAVSLQVEIRSTEAGQIIWTWAAADLLPWLDHAARSLPQLPWIRVSPSPAQVESLWPALQAYARCHTWLDRTLDRALDHASDRTNAATTIEPLDYQILVELMQTIDAIMDLPVPAAANFYVKTVKNVEQCFRRLEREITLHQLPQISAFRLGLVMLIKNLLDCLLVSILGQNAAQCL